MTTAREANRDRPLPGPVRAAAPIDLAERLAPRPLTDRARGWVVTLVVTAVAACVRLWNLGFPTDQGTPIFDEKHYVPQAWQMLRNGGLEDNAAYELVVHPPVGKQLIALGEAVFGYDSWGWRVSAALAGVLCVLLVVRIVRRMTRSTLLGGIAGVLLIADGVSHVQSRVGMLDIFLALFVLAAFGCLVVDRDQVYERMARVVREGRTGDTDFGPRMGVRWWRFSAGVLLGLACGTKWSGIYYVVAFALMSIAWDVFARRTAGVRRPWLGALARDGGPVTWALLVVPVATYLATWWAWFSSETGIDRHVVGTQIGTGGAFSFVPDALRSLWYYSGAVLAFHEGLVTPAKPHPWESKPWSWPMGLRPMLYYYESGSAAPGCGRSDCVSAVMLIGTPALWWISLPVLTWGLWRAVTTPDWRYAAALVGYLAGWLPWFIKIDRQMFFFYMTPVAPFLVIAVTLVLGELLGKAREGPERRGTGLLLVSLYVGLVVANFAWLWPIFSGDSITPAHWNAELWLPSWR